MNWIEREFGPDGREFFEPLIAALLKVARDMATGIKALKPRSWMREFTLWLLTAAVVAFVVLRPF